MWESGDSEPILSMFEELLLPLILLSASQKLTSVSDSSSTLKPFDLRWLSAGLLARTFAFAVALYRYLQVRRLKNLYWRRELPVVLSACR